ncbi:MAG: NAD-binding protein [Euryarchaeota archaeon]|nr:NAD-binding protein [Euryarchaeota archaeon]
MTGTVYVILGCGSVGFNVAKMLKERGHELLIIDNNKKRVENLRDFELESVVGDLHNLAAHLAALRRADAILLLGSNMEANLSALKFINRELPQKFSIARALDPVSAEAFEKVGGNSVLQPSEVIARSVVREVEAFEVQRTGSALTEIIKGARSVAIVLHSNPDPDALASGLALKAICTLFNADATIYYGGNIGHQENRAFVNLLELDLVRVAPKDDVAEALAKHDRVALVEANEPGRYNVLPKGTKPHMVFDHHPPLDGGVHADFADVRPAVGATSTIMTRYLQQLNVPVDARLATALLHGIRTDTAVFTRGATSEDMTAATFLSAFADMDLLARIEEPPLASETVDVLGKAIRNREVHGSHLLTCVEFIRDRDTLPQAADFLLKLEGITTVIVFGIQDDTLHISGRSQDVRVNLGDALAKAFGKQNAGGHAQSAGASIKLGIFGDVEDQEALVRLAKDAVRKQYLAVLGVEEQ